MAGNPKYAMPSTAANTTGDDCHPVFYAPIPPHPGNQNYVVLTLYDPSAARRGRRLRRAILPCAVIFLLSAAVFCLWPSDPELKLARLRVNHIQAHTFPKLAVDLSLSLTLKVRNRDFFSLDYRHITVSIGYRGRPLGFVVSEGGHLKARASSYVNATLELDGLEIVHDVFYLLEDLAKGVIPFDTETEIRGNLGLSVLQIPLEAKMACEVYVNITNQTINHQDCYSEFLGRCLLRAVPHIYPA